MSLCIYQLKSSIVHAQAWSLANCTTWRGVNTAYSGSVVRNTSVVALESQHVLGHGQKLMCSTSISLAICPPNCIFPTEPPSRSWGLRTQAYTGEVPVTPAVRKAPEVPTVKGLSRVPSYCGWSVNK